MRILWMIWTFLTNTSALLCSAGCLLPYWLRGSVTPSRSVHLINFTLIELGKQRHGLFISDIGLFRRCVYPVYGEEGSVHIVDNCGSYTFLLMPHLYWKIGLILLLFSTGILFYLSFLLIFLSSCCIDLVRRPVIFHTCQMAQLIASLLTMAACILYPLGWKDNNEVTQVCGQSVGHFYLGRCQIGWAYVLTATGGILSLVAASLPCLYAKHRPVSSAHPMVACNNSPIHAASSLLNNLDAADRPESICKSAASLLHIPSHRQSRNLEALHSSQLRAFARSSFILPPDNHLYLSPSHSVLSVHQAHRHSPMYLVDPSTHLLQQHQQQQHRLKVARPHSVLLETMGGADRVHFDGGRQRNGNILPSQYRRFSHHIPTTLVEQPSQNISREWRLSSGPIDKQQSQTLQEEQRVPLTSSSNPFTS